MLKVADLVRDYPEFRLQAGFTVGEGEFFSLLGPSGCGKTTLLRLISGLERPENGRIILNEQDVTDLPPSRRRIGLVFQDYALFPHMTVEENVGYGLAVQNVPVTERNKRIRRLLEQFEIGQLARREVGQLSGGERQRVALARALAPEPLVVLLDEPFSALDYGLRRRLREELRLLQRRIGFTAVFVTHHQEDALALSDRLAVMANGRILQVGSPKEVYERPESLEVAGLLGEANLLPGRVEESTEAEVRVMLGNVELVGIPGGKERLTVGQPVWVLVRPEGWTIHETGLVARVVGWEYLGHSTVYLVEGGAWSGRVLAGNGEEVVAVGQEVRLAIRPGQARVFARED
ncbi:MAG TPA: ABC transporter ATP-binding protein [Firmicutes bacterium]|jgi:ABC-type Fe3+/spermidine/putrescine transport system ATPase subunit|nr:ABC transporter ATP-binding protein [Bacillota bacterium]HOQ24374.1 ABC transporter ATP-binding protein [Bacillota bacterium]HPT67657.1 ABC transporter ATP-binding protein [Bacillota bacterium]